jgi:hypothetical protein
MKMPWKNKRDTGKVSFTEDVNFDVKNVMKFCTNNNSRFSGNMSYDDKCI